MHAVYLYSISKDTATIKYHHTAAQSRSEKTWSDRRSGRRASFFHAHPESAAADLKTHLGITHQAARAIVERMVNKGLLITHVSSHDARYKTVTLTAQGEELHETMHRNCTDFGDVLLDHISAEERDTLLKLITQTLDNLKNS
ncbi:MAG: MarR family winged helix-turn-helix transcriptional regulator [Butyricicoccaceae bacterium]